jgi:hypothetical protein
VSEGPLDGDDVVALGDRAAGEEVPEVMEFDAGQLGVAQDLAPPVADGVLVRIARWPGEQPSMGPDRVRRNVG